MQVFPGNYFNTKLRVRFLGSILMFLEFARLRQACGDLFFFQHEILPCTQLQPACFLAPTDRNCPEEKRDFWTHNFPPKRETLHPIHVVCIANIYSLNPLCKAIFSSLVFVQSWKSLVQFVQFILEVVWSSSYKRDCYVSV